MVSAENGLLVDPLNGMRSSGLMVGSLYRDEIHPSKEGNPLISETIASVIALWMVASI